MTSEPSFEAVVAWLWEGEVESEDDIEAQGNRLLQALGYLMDFDANAITTAFPKVMPLVSYPMCEVSEVAVEAMLQMIPDVAARSLIDALQTGSSRELAARAISILSRNHRAPARDGDSHLTPIVLALREHSRAITVVFASDPSVRVPLTHPVGLIGAAARDQEAFAALEATVTGPEGLVRIELARALAYFGDRAIPSLQRLLVDADAKSAAICALGFLGTPAAIAVLREFATTSAPDVVREIESTIDQHERNPGRRTELVAD